MSSHEVGSKPAQEPLAIVGIGCRLPGGVVDSETFWNFLAAGESGIVEVPEDRWTLDRYYHSDPSVPGRMHTKWGGFTKNLADFDARFWGITPREAQRMDPQQRWLLEVAWEAIEDSGTQPSKLRGAKVGCFVGVSTHDYSGIQGETIDNSDAHTNSGITLSIAANRVSYLLDLTGPSLSVDTACSSSLVALSIACRSIWAGECDAALVGGVNCMCTPHPTVGFAKASMLSPDGQCFAFDARANGYVRGEGAGMVYFKRLSQALADNDRIYSVIRAAVMNQDGHTSSMTVPGADAQAAMLRRAYMEAGLDPTSVMYMEAHGTGTPVGDPIELSALGRVLSKGRTEEDRCLVGSVKSNIGHLEAGSGIAGLIKASLVLRKDQVPPNANFQSPNPNIPFDELKLKVATELQPLPHANGDLPVTAVNSFGFGGTNSHAVLQAAPVDSLKPLGREPEVKAERPFALPVSAREAVSLKSYVESYIQHLGESIESLNDVCYTAGARKEHHDERLMFVGADKSELVSNMQAWLDNENRAEGEEAAELTGVHVGRATADPKPPVFVFTGQGAQWWKMGQDLLVREPIFRKTLERIDEILKQYGDFTLIEEMSRSEETSRINDTNIAQPAIFGLQVALAELWKSWGVEPAKVVGHSVGEVAAAYVAGIYSLEDAVKVIYHRSRLQNTTQGQGKMIAVGMSSKEVRDLIGEQAAAVKIAAVNSSNLVTIAGETEPLQEIEEKLKAAGTFHKVLPVDYPFHTHLMDPIKAELFAVLADIKPQPARIPFISTVTGGVYQAEQMDASYWWANVRNPVLFAPAIGNVVRGGDELFLELGPHPALRNPLNDALQAQGVKGAVFHSLMRKTDESQNLLQNVAGLHAYGVEIDWAALNQSAGKFVRLPRYPWNRERFWLEGTVCNNNRVGPSTHPLLGKRLESGNPTWEFQMDPRIFTYLESHRFWGSILFPAAGYGEISLALARAVFPDQHYTVEDMVVKKALFLSEEAVPTVRVEFNPIDKSYTIKSSTDLKDWDLHVEGRLTLYQSETPAKIDLEALKQSLPLLTGHDQYYKELDDAGFHFGPHFKLIKNVLHDRARAMIEVIVPDATVDPMGRAYPEGQVVDCAPGHHFHPILLDACLQVGKAAIDAPETNTASKNLYLPRRLGRVRLYTTEIPPRFWAYGKQRVFTEDMISFDIEVYDDEGNRVADIFDFRTEPMEHIRDDDDVESNLYNYVWQSAAELANEDEAAAEPSGEEVAAGEAVVDPVVGKSFAVFQDSTGVAEAVASQLESRGANVFRLSIGNEFNAVSTKEFTVTLTNEEDIKIALSSIEVLNGIVHCWSLDHSDRADLGEAEIEHAQQTGVLSALKMAHVLAGLGTQGHVYFVTRDAQSVADGDQITRPLSSAINGMARVAFNENPDMRWRTIDLQAAGSDSDAANIVAEIATADSEPEVAYRGGERMLKRIQRVRATEFPRRLKNAIQPDGSIIPYHLQIETPGILSNLSLDETRRREPGPGEVEAQVIAAGINFRNVMKALGMPIGNTIAFPGYGEDFAGTVLRVGEGVDHLKPGDHILGMGAGTFRGFVTTDARAVFKKPEAISFADAATIPTVFSTAYYALVWLANMRKGEKVLIHAGTGGVGQAAIQIAKELGLEVFATAGTPEKRDLLLELGADHAMHSRTLDFVNDVMRITDGKGVDCVLNSLAADFIPKSLSVLAPFGRFVEIGKVDIYNNTKIGMELLKDNISYFMFDLIEYIVQRTDHIAEMFVELGAKFEEGTFKPLTHTDFPITKVEEAYRYMAQGKHVGKNVLTFDVDEIPIGTCNEDGYLFRKDGSYLITGGASGFGLEVAKWMAMHGAGHVVLMSRSGPRDDESKAGVERVKELGASVTDARGDVTKLGDVQRIVDAVAADGHPPLVGVIHGAMVLRDEFIADLDDDLFQTVLRPKMNGAWNLHMATRELPLEHFMCFSSFSAVIGAPKQANYNAGNVFLEGLAHHRRSLGLAALTINWGALSGAGFVARNEKTAAYLDAIGMKSINIEEALRVIRRMLQHESPQVLASRADWRLWNRAIAYVGESNTFESVSKEQGEEAAGGSIGPRVLAAAPEARAPLLQDFIAENMAAVCSIDADGIDFDTPLTSLGLDSLMAVELMNRIEGEIGLSVPMGKVLAGPSIRELAEIMLEMMVGSGEGEEAEGGSSTAATAALAPLEATQRTPAFGLSTRQKQLWDAYQANPNGVAHTIVFAAQVEPNLDADRLTAAVREVVLAHPMLRVTFAEASESVQQSANAEIVCEIHEANGIGTEDLPEVVSQRCNRPFDLATASSRFELIRTKSAGDVLVFACHELAADRRSASIVVNDLLASYQEMSEGGIGEIGKQEFVFQDYVAWEAGYLTSDPARKNYEYWRDQLAGAPAALSLNDTPASAESVGAATALHRFELTPALSQQLLALAAEQETSLQKTLLTAYELTLHANCGQQDVLVGCDLPGRQHAELSGNVGPLQNDTVIRSSVSDDPTFAELLARTSDRIDWALSNQQYPLVKVLRRMDVPSASPIRFHFEMEPETSLDPRGLPAFLLGQSGHKFYAGDAKFGSIDIESHNNGSDLTLSVEEAGGLIFGTWRYNNQIVDAESVEKMNDAFQALFPQILDDPLTRISSLQLGGKPFSEWKLAADNELTIQAMADDVDPAVESRLDDSIQCEDTSYDFEKCDKVFLTGATGFVGAYLVDSLLKTTDAEVVCLVRADSQDHAQSRLVANLEKYGLETGDRMSRVKAVVGDLTLPRLGIEPAEFDALCHDIDVVYHNGADVNLAGNYAMLRDVNVNGTHECLRMALTHRVKPTHVVSSYSVQASHDKQVGDVVTEANPLPGFSQLQNGYAKTKWVCETMVAEARRRGLPVTIYRPGNITGHSETGAANTNDIMHTLMLGILHVGSVPELNITVDLTPVNFVAESIVHLSRKQECLDDQFNLLNHEPLSLHMMAKWLQTNDFSIGVTTMGEWRDALADLASSVPAEVVGLLVEVLAEEGNENDDFVPPAFQIRFDCSKAQAALADSNIRCHPVDDTLLACYRANLDKVGFFELVSDIAT